MDLIKTGKFIAECRKAKNLTQVALAQKIGVSEKTISKWECGNGFPDTSLILPLCQVLEISSNELLSGKQLSMEEYKSQAEQNILNLTKQITYKDKFLLCLEWVIGWLSVVILLTCVMIASYVEMAPVWRILLIVFGFINCLVGVGFALVIEKDAGYYECAQCKHKYVPTLKQVLFSMHMGRTRHLKCPNCKKRSWNKKTINND